MSTPDDTGAVPVDATPAGKSDWFVSRWTRSVHTTKLLPADESVVVGQVVQDLRRRSGRCAHGVGVYMAFWGFGNVHHRNTMLRGLRYALRPRVIVATQKKTEPEEPRSRYFEGFVCYQPTVLTTEELEAFFECFHMSIGVADLDTMMSDAMVTCIARVSVGEYEFGNWHALQNVCYRTEYAARYTQSQERDARLFLQQATGMGLSTSNMLALFHDRQNMRIDMHSMHAQLGLVRRLLDDDNDAVSTALTLATDVAGPPGEQIRNLLMQTLERNNVLTTNINAMAAVVERAAPPVRAAPAVVVGIMRRGGPVRPAALALAAATAAEFVPAAAAVPAVEPESVSAAPVDAPPETGFRRVTEDELNVIRSFLTGVHAESPESADPPETSEMHRIRRFFAGASAGLPVSGRIVFSGAGMHSFSASTDDPADQQPPGA